MENPDLVLQETGSRPTYSCLMSRPGIHCVETQTLVNISCKLEKASYNIFFVRAVMVKSLYTLRLSSGYNDLLNSENLKVAIAQLCHDIQVCNFTML